jgi:hypothetical protein
VTAPAPPRFARSGPVPVAGDLAFVNLGALCGVVEGDELVAVRNAAAAGRDSSPTVLIGGVDAVRAESFTPAVGTAGLERPAAAAGPHGALAAWMPALRIEMGIVESGAR